MSSKNSIFDYNSEDVRSGEMERPGETTDRPASGIRKHSRLIYFAVIVAISAILSVVLLSAIRERVNSGLIMELQPGDISVHDIEDGEYRGSFSSADMAATVTVDVTSGYIMDISLNEFKGIDTSRVGLVFDCVVASQSLDTGYEEIGTQPTDKILLMAIENALGRGGEE